MSKISNKKEERKTKSYGNLIEYFYLFGIEPDSINVDRFNDKDQIYLKKGYLSAELLSKFPPNEKADINVDIKIIKTHCFPNGYTLVQKNSNPVEEYFYFSLDNMLGKDTTDKCLNFCCVLFYEPIAKYVKIKSIKNPQHKKKLQKKEIQLDRFFAPKALCLSSFLSFPNEFKILLGKLINYVKSDKNTIPIEKIIENMIYGIPIPPRVHFYIHCKKGNSLFPKQDFEMNFRLSDLNQCPIKSFKYQSIFNFNIDDIIEIYKSLFLEVPILFFCGKPELLTNIYESFMTLMQPFEYQGPHCAILPDLNAGIIEMSKTFCLGINQEWIVPGNKEKKTYFQKLNLNIINKKILICDADNHKIYKYYNYNPVQHIINFRDLGNYSAPEGVDPLLCRSEDINHDCFNNWNEYLLPDHYTKKLKKSLKSYMDKNKMSYTEYSSKTNKEIGEQIFYYYLASIFQSYNDFLYTSKEDVKRICFQFLTKDLDNINIESVYKVKDFINVNNKDVAFYTKFFETNIFKEFLRKKYLFRDCDKYEILCFDETISSKRNKKLFSKKIKTEFKDCKYMKMTKTYNIKQTKDFDKDEYKYIEAHNDALLKYYQQYNNNKISYLIFPKFLYDNTFFDKSYQTTLYYENELYYIVDDSLKIYQKMKDSNIFSIYSNINFVNLFLFDINEFRTPEENENALYLLWLNIFCLTLHYCEEREKQFRYEEMMDLLVLVTLEKRRIINLIVSTLGKYGDEKMMIRFFENLKNFSYSSYCCLTSKFYNEKKIVSDLKKMNIANTRLSINYYRDSKVGINIFDIINNNSVKNLKPRTFELNTSPSNNPKDNSNQPTKEIVLFDDIVECNHCLKKIEIGELTINFKNMSKDPQLKCPECKQLFTPKVHIKFGDTVEKITLYGVYYLYNLSNELVKNYGSKMNMDDLRSKYKDFFWNCIWYFRLKGLSFDMMLKYKFINYYSVVNDNKNTQNKKRSFIGLEFQRQNA